MSSGDASTIHPEGHINISEQDTVAIAPIAGPMRCEGTRKNGAKKP